MKKTTVIILLCCLILLIAAGIWAAVPADEPDFYDITIKMIPV